ncbi:hypothetical protein TSAR_008969 [Trichomalopsis sarcophagae]|uniref:RNase H type-1 domain-containing protein n=1 Tax=Trichomalopsis sarcophagae TaxID=543379 RepID=A0A232EMG1_9HYME|nr:hypothetical protein TSAR_008969 [Trichomalopsis sarcophagae]
MGFDEFDSSNKYRITASADGIEQQDTPPVYHFDFSTNLTFILFDTQIDGIEQQDTPPVYHFDFSTNLTFILFDTQIAECAALNQAMYLALQYGNHDIRIFTDSLSVLENLKSTKDSVTINRYILSIKQKYVEFRKKNKESKLNFFWVPSHIGILGNEKADEIAKKATERNYPNVSCVPYTDLHEKFKRLAQSRSNDIIKKHMFEKGILYFKLYYSEKTKPWFHQKNYLESLLSQ